jgi:hypothetical protein
MGMGRQPWLLMGGILFSLGLVLSESSVPPACSRPLRQRSEEEMVSTPPREWLPAASRPQARQGFDERESQRMQQIIAQAEERGEALTTRPRLDDRRAAHGQQPRATSGSQERAAHSLMAADKAAQDNLVQQLQKENQRMSKQVENLSRDVVMLRGQLQEDEEKRKLHDGEEKRKHQLEYQAVLEHVRSELEANHIIELVAEKEKYMVEKTHVQSERAARERVEQELCREREQVRLLRAQVEDLQAQVAAAEAHACAEQVQHKQVQDELQASNDKAKEELAHARAAARELRKGLHAVRDEAMQDRQHLTALQNRLQGKAAQFEDQAGFLEQKMLRQQELLLRLQQAMGAQEWPLTASPTASPAASGGTCAPRVQGHSGDDQCKEAVQEATEEQMGAKLARKLEDAVSSATAMPEGAHREARNATESQSHAKLEGLLGDVRALLQHLVSPLASAPSSSSGRTSSTVSIPRSQSYPHQWRPFPGQQQALRPAQAVILRQGSGITHIAGGGSDCAMDRGMDNGMPLKSAQIATGFGAAGSAGTGVCAVPSQGVCRGRAWWQAPTWLACLARTSKHLAHLGIFITLGTPQPRALSLAAAVFFCAMLVAISDVQLRLPLCPFTRGKVTSAP